MVKPDPVERAAKGTERVDVGIADAAKIAKLNTQFVSSIGGRHEFGLIDSESGNEGPQVWERRFADPDNPDLGRLDEMHRTGFGQQSNKTGCGHPPCSSAPDNDDLDRFRHARSLAPR